MGLFQMNETDAFGQNYRQVSF